MSSSAAERDIYTSHRPIVTQFAGNTSTTLNSTQSQSIFTHLDSLDALYTPKATLLYISISSCVAPIASTPYPPSDAQLPRRK
jgi:hypothetical protein